MGIGARSQTERVSSVGHKSPLSKLKVLVIFLTQSDQMVTVTSPAVPGLLESKGQLARAYTLCWTPGLGPQGTSDWP